VFSAGWGLVAAAILYLFGRPIVASINDHADVVEATYAYLVIVPLSYAVLGASFVAGSAFVALGKALPSLILTLSRMVIVYLPLALLGNVVYGYKGVYAAGALANVLAGVAGAWWVRRVLPTTNDTLAQPASTQGV
jgi:Na+-driven multidrug efflux pump